MKKNQRDEILAAIDALRKLVERKKPGPKPTGNAVPTRERVARYRARKKGAI